MEKMNDLRDLLRHEIMDLYSAEEQIIKAMPAMIQKAKNPELKQSLQQHLKVTEGQRTRLDQVQRALSVPSINKRCT
jgi:ferritin-like metal-binding protein YciE